MDEQGEWRPTATGEPGIVSFHISALYSPFKKYSWGKLAREFVEANKLAKKGDHGRLQAFVNTVLGETWKDYESEKKLRKPHELAAMCKIRQAEVPLGVKFLTAGIDTQSGKRGSGGYWVASVYGWGAREKPYLISHHIFTNPVEGQTGRQELADLLTRKWHGEDGRTHVIQAACIDTGGDYGAAVLDFVATWRQKTRLAERWFPIKGWGKDGQRESNIWRTPIGTGLKTHSIEVNRAKDLVFNKIHGGQSRDDLIVFPMSALANSTQIDADFFDGLTKEKREWVTGLTSPVWEKGVKGNEPWDCLVYSFAAVQALKSLPPPNAYIAALDGPAPEPEAPREESAPSDAPAPKPAPSSPAVVKKRKKGPRLVRATW